MNCFNCFYGEDDFLVHGKCLKPEIHLVSQFFLFFQSKTDLKMYLNFAKKMRSETKIYSKENFFKKQQLLSCSPIQTPPLTANL